MTDCGWYSYSNPRSSYLSSMYYSYCFAGKHGKVEHLSISSRWPLSTTSLHRSRKLQVLIQEVGSQLASTVPHGTSSPYASYRTKSRKGKGGDQHLVDIILIFPRESGINPWSPLITLDHIREVPVELNAGILVLHLEPSIEWVHGKRHLCQWSKSTKVLGIILTWLSRLSFPLNLLHFTKSSVSYTKTSRALSSYHLLID